MASHLLIFTKKKFSIFLRTKMYIWIRFFSSLFHFNSPENMGRLSCSSNSISLPLWEEEVVCKCMESKKSLHLAKGKYSILSLNSLQENSSKTSLLRKVDIFGPFTLIHSQNVFHFKKLTWLLSIRRC